jgi:general secretion pathway protein D
MLLALAAVGFASRSHAQGNLPPSPGSMLSHVQNQATTATTTLLAVSVVEDAPGEARVVLNFSPHAPGFSIIKSDGDHPAIAFAGTTRDPSARAPGDGKGLFRSIEFRQQGPILIMRLGAAASVKMAAAATGDQIVTITLTADRAGTPTSNAGGLPKATQASPGEDGFEVVPLKYADISEVVGLLTEGQTVSSNDVFIPTEPAFGSAGVGGNPNAPTPPQNPVALDRPMAQAIDTAISVDRRLNAIILKGTPESIARLKAKIAAIDVPVQSVILETMFVELDESGAANVGFNFNNSNNQIGVATLQTGNFSSNNATLEYPQVSLAIQAAIQAQVQKGHGRIVSKPRISAQSGSTAKIITGDALPILTSIALSGVNAVSQQVQYVNVGVTLQIAPRVSATGFVTSHVFCVVSSVTGTSQGYPTISQREAETSATVRDGETFVIGGLTVESDIGTDSKVPGLGDIPLIGHAFRVRNGTKAKTDLYIVVTPTIIKRGDYALLANGAGSATPAAQNQLTSEPAPAPAPPPPSISTPATSAPAMSAPTGVAPTAAAPTMSTPAVSAPTAAAAPVVPQAASADDAASAASAQSAPIAQAVPSARRVAGRMSVQIGAFDASSQARKALDYAAAKLPDQMAGKVPTVERASKDGKPFYRASITGFATRTDAAAFCTAMQDLNKPCFVTGRRDARPALNQRSKIAEPSA